LLYLQACQLISLLQIYSMITTGKNPGDSSASTLQYIITAMEDEDGNGSQSEEVAA